MGEKTGVSLSLERKQLDWLEIMSKKYGLPTPGKAFRIVILYTKQKEHDAADIFAKVQSIVDDDSTLVNSLQKLDDVMLSVKKVSKQHDYYLQELVSKYGLGSKDKAARVVLDYAMTSGDESTIFEVKRCRHGSTCKNC